MKTVAAMSDNPQAEVRSFDDTLAGAPAAYRTPAVRPSLAEAQAYCKQLAETHYENFHVATWFLPKRLRPHFQTIYAYCRIADDLGDEITDTAVATQLLKAWGAMLDECYAAPERSRHPVFVALAETIKACNIPKEPFADLLVAFTRDQTVTRYETLEGLFDYSRYSADPVGRLVLYASGQNDVALHPFSDMICTGLQLANFWQDVREDCEAGRLYLPNEEMKRYGVSEVDIGARHFTPEMRALMVSLVAKTRVLFREGRAIFKLVDKELAATLRLFVAGGEAILDAIEAQDYNVLTHRPTLSKTTKAKLLAGALWNKVRG